MERLTKRKEEPRLYPMGAVKTETGMHFSIASPCESCSLVFFQKGKQEPVQTIAFENEDKIGDVWNITLSGDFRGLQYACQMDGVLKEDPYGRHFTGREVWGEDAKEQTVLYAILSEKEYNWEDDVSPRLAYEDMVIYRLHPRGFTRHSSSKVKAKGTFAGITEKIPYLQDLGITAVELLPPVEFQEVLPREQKIWKLDAKEEEEQKTLNYWGFIPALSFAPKAAYTSAKEKYPGWEFKDMVKAFHRAGMEVIIDLFFSGNEPESQVLDVLRFWAGEYHVDGIHLVGSAPTRFLAYVPPLI